jgi:protein SCO1/2
MTIARQKSRVLTLAIAMLAMLLCGLPRALAEHTPENGPVDLAGRVPDEIKNVGVDEHLGSQIPMDLEFINERGETVKLGDYFQGNRPVILQLGYFDCPMLCSLVSRGIMDSVKDVNLKAGSDFDMVFVSIDPSESPSLAALKKQNTIEYYGKPEEASGFHFLVGKDNQIAKLADTVGFRYEKMEDTQQYAHAAVIFIVTPQGKLSRYLYGIKFDPQTVHLSLVEASQNKIGTTMDQILLLCLHYDSASGKYGWAAVGLMRLSGLCTVLTLGGTMFYLFRREHRQLALGKTPLAGEVKPKRTHL